MSHLIGYLTGKNKTVSRTGTKSSGISASVQGWTIGGQVRIWHNEHSGKDVLCVDLYKGSNNTSIVKTLVFNEDDLK